MLGRRLLTLMREVLYAVRWILRADAQWRVLPYEPPLWEIDYQQAHRWLTAEAFAKMAHDLRELLRWLQGRADGPSPGPAVESPPRRC